MTYYVAEAFAFYRQYLLGPLEAKAPFFAERNIRMAGVIHYRDWEVFIAILVDDRGNPEAYGADLTRHEAKSAQKGRSFEYQYHRDAYLTKLEHDKTIDHLFVSYSKEYRDLDVYLLRPEQYAHVAETEDWRKRCEETYRDPSRQRCRQRIGYREVVEKGRVVMVVRDGEIAEAPPRNQPMF